jgi:hypothetical protein
MAQSAMALGTVGTFKAIRKCGIYSQLSLIDRSAITFATSLRQPQHFSLGGVNKKTKNTVPKLDLRRALLPPQMMAGM